MWSVDDLPVDAHTDGMPALCPICIRPIVGTRDVASAESVAPMRRGITRPALIVLATALAIVLGAVIYGWFPRPNPLLDTPEGKRVDKLLRKSLPDGGYQVIAWWPPQDSAAIRDAEIALWEAEVADSATRVNLAASPDAKNAVLSRSIHDEARLRGLRESASVKICRLKFRYKDEDGTFVDGDSIFLLTDRQALFIDANWPSEQRIEALARAEFAE